MLISKGKVTMEETLEEERKKRNTEIKKRNTAIMIQRAMINEDLPLLQKTIKERSVYFQDFLLNCAFSTAMELNHKSNDIRDCLLEAGANINYVTGFGDGTILDGILIDGDYSKNTKSEEERLSLVLSKMEYVLQKGIDVNKVYYIDSSWNRLEFDEYTILGRLGRQRAKKVALILKYGYSESSFRKELEYMEGMKEEEIDLKYNRGLLNYMFAYYRVFPYVVVAQTKRRRSYKIPSDFAEILMSYFI